jgi:hypothetical protein
MKGLVISTLLYLAVSLGLATAAATTDTIIFPGEQQSTLICSTNYNFLEWNVSTIRYYHTRAIYYYSSRNLYLPILINSANFTLSRVSSPGALPLVSTMTIMNVTSDIEGTVITCTGLNSSSESTVVLMTTLHVYDMDVGRPLIQVV